MATARVQETIGQLQAAVRDGVLANLHSVVAFQQGQALLEAYFEGEDERYGRSLGRVQFGPDVPHDLRSVSKSIVGLLFGMVAIERRLDMHALLSSILVQRRAQFGPAAQQLTLAHVATMTMGLQWDESISYADPKNAERQMAAAPDRVAYVLGLEPAEPPGQHWHYCGGATELLAAVITDLTGCPLLEFATRRLFQPLGLQSVEWMGDDKGPFAASGLRLIPLELARIGQLVLQNGDWQGRPIVPGSWLREALRPRVPIEGDMSYGYHFYAGGTVHQKQPVRFSAAFGNGGQHLYVLPELNAVVVITAGHYNDFGTGHELPGRVLREHILPLLAAGAAYQR